MNIVVSPSGSELLSDVCEVCEAVKSGQSFNLQTSGTTGEPKSIPVDLQSAFDAKKPGSSNERWLLCYQPSRWAGVSVILHALKSSCTLCVPASVSISGLVEGISQLCPTHLSCTPSLFRNLVRTDEDGILSRASFCQITFGGEAATQSVLDLAKFLWPKARVSHVYASTEFGDICSVSDCRAGIPQEKFSRYTFSIEGELVVNGIPTGDLWDLIDGRYHFRGRRDEIINVGGNKVSPIQIEEFAIQQGATGARAFAISNALMGSLVGLEYSGGLNEREMALKFRSAFQKFAWPASLKKIDYISITPAGKTKRI
jgi:acyl-CoA synthetase (AMP-forming)/AMP-acid ligase II